MVTSQIQQAYENALRDLQSRSRKGKKLPARQQPIFQRRQPRTGQQAIQDAAIALTALWKLNTGKINPGSAS
jgi:hypothetical protein